MICCGKSTLQYKTMSIVPDILISELIEKYPQVIGLLASEGIKCVRCGQPVWGTLREAASEKGLDDTEVAMLVNRLNETIEGSIP